MYVCMYVSRLSVIVCLKNLSNKPIKKPSILRDREETEKEKEREMEEGKGMRAREI